MLPQRAEVGQGQPADPEGPLPSADPDERPGGIQGEDQHRDRDRIESRAVRVKVVG